MMRGHRCYISLFRQCTSGKERYCWQDSRLINDYVQQVSHRTVSSDLSLWRKQSMDCSGAQSDALPLLLLPHQTESQTDSSKDRRDVLLSEHLHLLSTTDFRSWVFDVDHYLAEKSRLLRTLFRQWVCAFFFRSKYYCRSISLVPSEGFLELHILRFTTYNYA